MPTYSYKCSKCEQITEAFQNISEAPLTDCPNCGESALQRVLLSAPTFQLKGKGWYKTDYTKPVSKSEDKTAAKSADTTEKTQKSSQAESSTTKGDA